MHDRFQLWRRRSYFVLAVGDSQYQLSIAQDAAASIVAAHTTAKARPQHPLVISDPLSAGVVSAPQELPAYRAFLPVLTK